MRPNKGRNSCPGFGWTRKQASHSWFKSQEFPLAESIASVLRFSPLTQSCHPRYHCPTYFWAPPTSCAMYSLCFAVLSPLYLLLTPHDHLICKTISHLISTEKTDFFLFYIITAWSLWSPCYPLCGNHRRRIRYRVCLGDFGCYGSMQMSRSCKSVTCPDLDEIGRNNVENEHPVLDQQQQQHQKVARYFKPDFGFVFFVTVCIMLPSQVAIIVVFTCVIHWFDRRRYNLQ